MGLARNELKWHGMAKGPMALAHDIKGLGCPRKKSKRPKRPCSHACKQVQRFIRDAFSAGWREAYERFQTLEERS